MLTRDLGVCTYENSALVLWSTPDVGQAIGQGVHHHRDGWECGPRARVGMVAIDLIFDRDRLRRPCRSR